MRIRVYPCPVIALNRIHLICYCRLSAQLTVNDLEISFSIKSHWFIIEHPFTIKSEWIWGIA